MAHDHRSFAFPVPLKDSAAAKQRSEWRAYGILRFSTTLFAELRDVVFVRVTQRAIRRVALTVFRHMHSLSLRFHLERQTGGVSRDIERGTRGISTLLTYMLFSIVPVILEFSLVAVILLTKFDWRFAAVTFVAVALYIAFSVSITEWRMEIRRRANELDSKANTRAIDSLLNYETVKYFNNEEYEARRYDENLQKYESAAVKNEASLGLLNIGQSCIIAVAVTLPLGKSAGSATVRFERVDFSYEPRRQILFDLSFEIPAGSKVAVVGASGSGKSTLARLLFRFYDVDAGRITVNGTDIRGVTQSSLRAAIGIVPQDTVLFNDTILYNIHYGRPDASPAEVIEAAKAAHIHEFIESLPDRYESRVGERGLQLSR